MARRDPSGQVRRRQGRQQRGRAPRRGPKLPRQQLRDRDGFPLGRRRHPSRHRLRRPPPHARRQSPRGRPPGPPATDHGLGVSPRTLGEAFDALLGDLLTAGKIALDAEVVATLAAYYRARLADPDASTASVNDALKTLAHVLQEGGNHAPPAEVDALFPRSSPASAPASRDVSRHALNALGALVSRSPAGTVTAAAHAAAGDAVVAALDRIADGARGGAFPEDSSASRHLAAATRCAQLCAAPERASWSEATVAALVAHLRRCFAYGVGARRTDAERRGGGTGTDLPRPRPRRRRRRRR